MEEENIIFNSFDDRKKLYSIYFYFINLIKNYDTENIEKNKTLFINKFILYYYLLILLVYNGDLLEKLKTSYHNNDNFSKLILSLIDKLTNKEFIIYIDYNISFTILKLLNENLEDQYISRFIHLFSNKREDILIVKLSNNQIKLLNEILNEILNETFDNDLPEIPHTFKLKSTASNNIIVSEFKGGKKKTSSNKNKQVIILPPFCKWSPKFKKTLFERIGNWNSIKEEDDMRFAKEIRLIINNKTNMITIEIDWNTDIIEVLKNDLPLSIKNKIIKKK